MSSHSSCAPECDERVRAELVAVSNLLKGRAPREAEGSVLEQRLRVCRRIDMGMGSRAKSRKSEILYKTHAIGATLRGTAVDAGLSSEPGQYIVSDVNIDQDETDRRLLTVAEASDFRKTGRSDEVARLCAAY